MRYIEWDYLQAKRQADRLEEQADVLDRLASNQMEESLQRIAYSWKGENAGIYICKGNKAKNEIKRLSRELRRTAAVIRSSAERMYRAEMRAKALACTLKH